MGVMKRLAASGARLRGNVAAASNMNPVNIRFRKGMVFFDRGVIRRNWSSMNTGPLRKAGALVRMNARQSIRRRRKLHGKPSKRGSPPYARTSSIGGTPPFKLIYNLPYRRGTTEIVGMVGFDSESVPGLHEHGGRATRYVFVKRGTRARRTYRTKSGRRTKRKGKGFGGAIMKRERRRVTYPARPFMNPALVRAKPKIAALWRDSIITGRN